MVLGLLSVIAGLGIILAIFFFETTNVLQQNIQYLGFIAGSIFIVGGFIMITISFSFKKLSEQIAKPLKNEFEIKNEENPKTKTCPYCAEEVKLEAKVCKYCKNVIVKRKAPAKSGMMPL